MNKTELKISVCMITYGHEQYIRQAIDGVLMQECDYEIELIIADDKSPDDTKKVVAEIVNNHPNGNWIKYTKHKENKGVVENFIWALNQCTGKYIALCEGDDYWTDPLKLQKQVDFMEANEEYGLICGKANKYFQERNEFDGFFGVPEAENYETAILAFNDVVTASTLIRKDKLLECQNDCQDLMQKNLFIDTTMWYWFAYNSKIKFVDEISVVYRVLEESASHTKDPERRLELDMKFMYIKQHFLLKYPPKKREHLTTIVDTIHKEYETIVKFAQYVESVKMRQTKSFRLGNKIKKIISIFVPNSK